MGVYDKNAANSDLDAFKNSGLIRTASITINDVVGAGGLLLRETAITVPDGCDLCQIMYDNSVYHSGKFKDITKDPGTAMPDSITFGGAGSCYLYTRVQGNQLILGVAVNNPYSSALTCGPVTYNFRVIPYEATF